MEDDGDEQNEAEDLDGEELNSDEDKGKDGEKDEDDIPGFAAFAKECPQEPLPIGDVKTTEQRPSPKTNEEIVAFISALVNVEDDAVDESLDYAWLAELASRHPLHSGFCQQIEVKAGPEWSFCHPEGDPLEDLRDFCLWLEKPGSTTLVPPSTSRTSMECDGAPKARF